MIEQIALEVAHKTCTIYAHLDRLKYGFTDQNMIDFATKLIAAWKQQSPKGESKCYHHTM